MFSGSLIDLLDTFMNTFAVYSICMKYFLTEDLKTSAAVLMARLVWKFRRKIEVLLSVSYYEKLR